VISFLVTCPQHGNVSVNVDDMLIAVESFMVHCPEVDHLFLQALTPKVAAVLVGSGVEQLCP
jgi:hypothetical protein